MTLLRRPMRIGTQLALLLVLAAVLMHVAMTSAFIILSRSSAPGSPDYVVHSLAAELDRLPDQASRQELLAAMRNVLPHLRIELTTDPSTAWSAGVLQARLIGLPDEDAWMRRPAGADGPPAWHGPTFLPNSIRPAFSPTTGSPSTPSTVSPFAPPPAPPRADTCRFRSRSRER